jgi:hypothetical protein
MKKLDGQRSYDESRSYGKYYRINDLDELCVRIDFPEEAESIQESIIVAPIEGDSSSSRCKKRSISTHPKRGYPFTFLTRSS